MTDKPKKEPKIEVKDLPQPEQELTAEDAKKVKGGLNRVNETVTNLDRSQSDAQKSTAQNLSV